MAHVILDRLHPRIAWHRCSRRRWPGSGELPFTPEQARKPRYVLLYFWAGRGLRTTPQGDVELTPGSCHWSRPGFTYRCRQIADDPLGITAIHFDLVDINGQLTEPPRDPQSGPPEILHVPDHAVARAVTDHVAYLSLDLRSGVAVSQQALKNGERLFDTLLRCFLLDTVTTPAVGQGQI